MINSAQHCSLRSTDDDGDETEFVSLNDVKEQKSSSSLKLNAPLDLGDEVDVDSLDDGKPLAEILAERAKVPFVVQSSGT